MNTSIQIAQLVQIQKIDPVNGEIFSPIPLKNITNNKGKAVFLNSLQSVNTIAVLEFVPNAGVRANHYHHQRTESLYIIEGKLKLYVWLPNSPEIDERIVESGHLITVKPGLGHAYKAIDHTWALEMGFGAYNAAETVFDPRIGEDNAGLLNK